MELADFDRLRPLREPEVAILATAVVPVLVARVSTAWPTFCSSVASVLIFLSATLDSASS